MKHATEEQKAAAAERRDKFYGLAKSIAAMTDEQRSAMAAKMPVVVTVEGHPLSGHNTLLIAAQGGENVTMVGGFHQWIKAGRCVCKGEHGYMIWIPKRDKAAEGEEEGELGFITGTVFDVSQTAEVAQKAA